MYKRKSEKKDKQQRKSESNLRKNMKLYEYLRRYRTLIFHSHQHTENIYLTLTHPKSVHIFDTSERIYITYTINNCTCFENSPILQLFTPHCSFFNKISIENSSALQNFSLKIIRSSIMRSLQLISE